MSRARLLGALALSLAFVSCSSGAETPRRDALAAVRRTARAPYTFAYEERSGGRVVAVDGLVQDVFRYRLRLRSGEQEMLEQVTSDDALAVRVLPAAAPMSASLRVPADGRWLLDATGAGDPLFAQAAGSQDPGRDPAIDAITVLDHVERAVERAVRVVVFNPESVDYRPQDDPFPKPAKGVLRYDLARPDLPRPNALGSPVPEVKHFRKLSVYVREGVVQSVLEEIDVGSRASELASSYRLKLPKDEEEAMRAAPGALAALLRAKGSNPIRPRTMSASFTDVGKPATVTLPVGAAAAQLRGFGTAVFGDTAGAAPRVAFDPSQLAAVPGVATPPPAATAPRPRFPAPAGSSVALGLLVVPVLGAVTGAWLWARRPSVLRASRAS